MRAFFLLLVTVSVVSLRAQRFDSLCLQLQHVWYNLQEYHYSPPKFDNAVNSQVLGIFIKQTDERGIFFTEPDKNRLAVLLKENDSDAYCELIKTSFALVKKRLSQLDSIIGLIEQAAIDFSVKDTILFIRAKQSYPLPANLSQLRYRLEKRIKYECLYELVTPKKDSLNVLRLKPMELATLMESYKTKSVRRLKQFLGEYRNPWNLGHLLADGVCNALTQRCDPHSNYFNAYQMEDYKSTLSTSDVSFGFYADENDEGQVSISELVPGGPAWKSNSLNEGDVIVAFSFEGEPLVEIGMGELDFFYEQFGKSTGKSVELTVRKKDLKITNVRLTKEKIESQENTLNSYVISYNQVKIGLIPIPSFYTDDEEDSRQGCANDVAKEIIELKHDSIQGLILDLRYNGGGSMREAMGLSGIFIDEGPVAVYRPKTGKPYLLKDLNRGSIWDGPLIILVNSASASASEFVAASLQDYNRALIAGSKTYGKGTAQYLFMNDSSAYKLNHQNESPLGYLKLTGGKFYRLSTESHQGKGIEPDLPIPGIIEKIMVTERNSDYFLPCDTVMKKVVYTPLPAPPKQLLRQLSEQRIRANPRFATIGRLGDSLQAAYQQNLRVALNLKDMKQYFDRQRMLEQRIDAIFIDAQETIKVANNSANEKIITMNDYYRKNTDRAIEVLKKDLILHETVYILNDLINAGSR